MPRQVARNEKMPTRLLPRVLWRVLPGAVLVLFSIWLLASYVVTRTLSAELERSLDREAVKLAEAASAKLSGVVATMAGLASNDFIVNGLIDIQERASYLPVFFKSLRLPGSLGARVTLADYRGRTIVSNIKATNYENAPWLARAMAGEEVVEFSPAGMVIAIPIWQSGQPEGIMVMEQNTQDLSKLLQVSSVPHVVEIRTSGDLLLYRSDEAQVMERHSDMEPRHERWLAVEAAVPNFPDLRLRVAVPEKIAFAPARRLDRFMLAALVLSTIAIAAGIAATAYFATSPLDRFIAAINKIGGAEGLGYRILPFGSREFHILTGALNDMLESLESTTTSRNYFDAVLNSIAEMLFVTDMDGNVRTVNLAVSKVTGWSTEELELQPIGSIVEVNEAIPQVTNTNSEFLATDPATFEGCLMTRCGVEIPVQVSVSLLAEDTDEQNARLIYVLSDITERKRAEQELAALAQYDTLTGLANRTLFHARLGEALAQARRTGSMVALMLLDLDRFKDVNDTLGHPVGDALLKLAAERLRHATRETDTVARLGGDEFAVIATNLDSLDGASSVAGKLIDAIKTPFSLDGKTIHTATSIGISVSPPDEPDATAMFNHADYALYQAKSAGRGSFQFFDEKLNQRRLARKAVEDGLDMAIADDQLVLFYQPKLNAVSGEITGVEALIRWDHPERGLIPPSKFIPVAESTGRIAELSTWVLRSACSQQFAWREMGLGTIPIAINLSPAQFKDHLLHERILEITTAYDIDPQSIELEITESTIIHNIEDVNRQLSELHRQGYRIYVDDFGTGYSSLAHLNRFPIDALKIDRSFITNVCENNDDAVIVKAMVALAHSLKIKALAEGVETHEQLAFLRRCKCPEVQGYYFSPPVPADEFVAWRATHVSRPAIMQVEDIECALR